LKSLGAFVTKGVTLKPKRGNPELRIVETRAGLLNSIGLQNKGAKVFLSEELPKLLRYELPVIVNISANSVEEFGDLAGYLMDNDVNKIIAGLEINVSCPNIREGGAAFGANPKLVERIAKAIKKRVGDRVAVITKLTPNVADITEPAKAAIAGGTDALSMINTLRGMAIDIENKKPYLGNVTGGLSGPAIKPVGVFMVYECFRKIPVCRNRKVPIIGIGGISMWQDALEYIMAGATAVGIGTAWFVNTRIFCEVRDGIKKYLSENNKTIGQLVGISHKS
jgi:dihydroorotate dehydrogenase (NAD+) catalytic subunit